MGFYVSCKIQYLLMLLLLFFVQNAFHVCGYRLDGSDDEVVPDFPKTRELNEMLKRQVSEWGFKLEIHEVCTEDNYILTVHRLYLKKDDSKAPVYIMHGINGCSATYLAFRNSLAFYLAERGYDVWVGNARGTAFSLKHKIERKMSYKRKRYWKFSWHEIGYYDAPAILTHIKKETGAEKIHYVGMSMGTTVFLVMSSTRHQFLQDIATISLIAPVARPKHFDLIRNATHRLFFMLYAKIVQFIGAGNFFQYRKSISSTMYKACRSKSWKGRLCEFRALSKGLDLFDFESSLETFLYYPCGTSIRTYTHFIQVAEAGIFQQFNHGTRKNKRIYKTRHPPEYDLPSIDKTIYMIVGGEDTRSDKRDVIWLHDRLQDPVYITTNFEDFDHRDFNYSITIFLAHETILNIIEAYEEGTEPLIEMETIIREQFPEDMDM